MVTITQIIYVAVDDGNHQPIIDLFVSSLFIITIGEFHILIFDVCVQTQ